MENNPEGDEGRPPVGMNIPMADNVISGKSKAIADQDLITLMDTGLNADQTDFINKVNKQSVASYGDHLVQAKPKLLER